MTIVDKKVQKNILSMLTKKNLLTCRKKKKLLRF